MPEEYQHPDHQRKVGETLQDYLERVHSMQLHPKRTQVYSLAYSLGHGCGEQDVVSVYEDLLELVKPSQPETGKADWLTRERIEHLIKAAQEEDRLSDVSDFDEFPKLCRMALAALAVPQEGVNAEYEGDTAKGWYEAWDRENDAWQALVAHHTEVEDATKIGLTALEHAAQLIHTLTGADTSKTLEEIRHAHAELVKHTSKNNGDILAALKAVPQDTVNKGGK